MSEARVGDLAMICALSIMFCAVIWCHNLPFVSGVVVAWVGLFSVLFRPEKKGAA